jgi:hypothetical protein
MIDRRRSTKITSPLGKEITYPDYVGANGTHGPLDFECLHEMNYWAHSDGINYGNHFFVFLEKDPLNFNIKGRMEDLFGNSTLEGTMDDNFIIFTKVYDKEQPDDKHIAITSSIEYQGVRVTIPNGEEFFSGIFLEENYPPGIFIMRTYSKEK